MINAFKLRVEAFLVFVGIVSAQLSPDYYAKTCPNVLPVIKSAVKSAVANETCNGASLLRLHFHDCVVNRCDASVLLDGLLGEKTSIPNINSLKGFEIIDSIKYQLESSCPGVLSCADILAVASRDSVVAFGGPSWTVRVGRRDSLTASSIAPALNLPPPTFDLSLLIPNFAAKGFNIKELVALSGAHTIGKARCVNFRGRIYNESNINSSYAASLRKNCPFSGGDDNLADLSVTTPTTFDNSYFTSLLSQNGLLHSDQQLFNGGGTDSQVRAYSSNATSFFRDFADAMIKMGNLSPLIYPHGQIRRTCRVVN
ncbi:hypothetical protein JCGZ_00381 [Jatropha curcas]|uniref:Peroxidase n=1 Tax=Jatropha curcas TaxID=180498 RepID=A0A067JTD6_JATCU|nr:cationic peroxidase 1 [Jatropha curcas]KDP22794.1 hypothetical protein JCGZ_00381 [Jatropha curcas]